MTLDYRKERFYFQRDSHVKDTSNSEFGFTATVEGEKAVIRFVSDESLKDKIHHGDEILEVNGIPVGLCGFLASKKDRERSDTLELKLKSRNGTDTFKITLKSL